MGGYSPYVKAICSAVICITIGGAIGYQFAQNHHWFSEQFFSPMLQLSGTQPKNLPLNEFSIPALQLARYSASTLNIIQDGVPNDGYTQYLFTLNTRGKNMTGQLNVPDAIKSDAPAIAIVLLRGYVPPEQYVTGVGTKNAAARFAQAGYITLAPDFFGYGGSDAEPSDPWQARFEKPAIVAELLKTIESGIPINRAGATITPTTVGIWAHSNGGQIALTTLEVLRASYPTTLWAPVTAPFPYSILYFGDEVADEGKSQRAWIALFERDYDAHQFSHTQFLADLRGPLQFQQGVADDAAPYFWTEEFLEKIKAENLRRTTDASAPAAIEYTYHKYPGANHNLVGAWETAIQRDLEFFAKHLH